MNKFVALSFSLCWLMQFEDTLMQRTIQRLENSFYETNHRKTITWWFWFGIFLRILKLPCIFICSINTKCETLSSSHASCKRGDWEKDREILRNSQMHWNESHWDEIIYCGTANKSVHNVQNGSKTFIQLMIQTTELMTVSCSTCSVVSNIRISFRYMCHLVRAKQQRKKTNNFGKYGVMIWKNRNNTHKRMTQEVCFL